MYSSVKWLSRVWTWTIPSLLLLPFGERVEKHRDHQRRRKKACVLTMHLPYLIGAKQTWLGPIWRTIGVLHRRDVSQSLLICFRAVERQTSAEISFALKPFIKFSIIRHKHIGCHHVREFTKISVLLQNTDCLFETRGHFFVNQKRRNCVASFVCSFSF